jgi:hypothetical protein
VQGNPPGFHWKLLEIGAISNEIRADACGWNYRPDSDLYVVYTAGQQHFDK